MIGNDIVDLNFAANQNDWQRKGFLDKVFTKYEQELVENSSIPDNTVWLLWSMKESAYKRHVRQNQGRFFAPKKIHCILTAKTEGVVRIKNQHYNTKSEITPNFIHTTTGLGNAIGIMSNCFNVNNSDYSNQHDMCYERLLLEVSKKFKVPIHELEMKKDTLGIPWLYQNERQLNISFSLSHHGNYGAYSLLS